MATLYNIGNTVQLFHCSLFGLWVVHA